MAMAGGNFLGLISILHFSIEKSSINKGFMGLSVFFSQFFLRLPKGTLDV
jgi:hypothetical protein